ncbi:protein-ADP-ribose hydrolase [Limosilactobacillus caecicola]|uniref:protein-ADP-ribose hydrolase n=1 Tax=Limosilactobacillus caecicola TaxID=2941332 RepID=UPI00203FD1D6|nr:protein-ADP-ribose hydrolase [Limosilactobacillus caecicola]
MNQIQRREYLIKKLLAENPEYASATVPEDEPTQRLLLRALMNVRAPKEISAEFQQVQDEYLQAENAQQGVVTVDQFQTGLNLWRGDITRLAVGAIVNAANSGLTGCYLPNHNCIDNAIHTFAGIELRNACAALMKEQGHPEATGQAKITPAFNLPSDYVIHTVGPIVEGDQPTPQDEQLLASSYRSSLALADQNGVESIAFPCISTGVFHFPNQRAAEIAVATTREYMKQAQNIQKVIFDVFKEEDYAIYEQLL